MQKFDDKLMSDYMEGFWGYGTINARYWFVGMEEGGGDSFEEVNQRISQWDKRGRHRLEDLYDYHRDINVPKWFQKDAPLQPTWNRLIRVLLSAKGDIPEKEIVKTYQIEQLGRSNGESCLLEFLPLPSPAINHWHYGKFSEIPYLSDRKQYTQTIGSKRAAYLKNLITTNQPEFVLFYGIGYLKWWNKVLNSPLTEEKIQGKTAYFGRLGNTAIAVTQHPVATGVKLDYFHRIGRKLGIK